MLVRLRILIKNGPKIDPKSGQKWSKNGNQYFFTFDVKKVMMERVRTPLELKEVQEGSFNFRSYRVLGPSWTDFNFFGPPFGRLLGPSGCGQGAPGGLPGALWRLFLCYICIQNVSSTLLYRNEKIAVLCW